MKLGSVGVAFSGFECTVDRIQTWNNVIQSVSQSMTVALVFDCANNNILAFSTSFNKVMLEVGRSCLDIRLLVLSLAFSERIKSPMVM
jgi:hypothetical protein